MQRMTRWSKGSVVALCALVFSALTLTFSTISSSSATLASNEVRLGSIESRLKVIEPNLDAIVRVDTQLGSLTDTLSIIRETSSRQSRDLSYVSSETQVMKQSYIELKEAIKELRSESRNNSILLNTLATKAEVNQNKKDGKL